MGGIMIFGVFVLVLASPFLIGMFFKQYFKYKSESTAKLAELELKVSQGENELLQRRVTTLQQRVEVLERIVTDDRYELTRQIAGISR